MPAEPVPTDEAGEHREREIKLAVPDGWVLPDPAALAGEGGTVRTRGVELTSTYYDTAARDLYDARVTLRRREGPEDAGWQLKLPDGDARLELRLPAAGRRLPPAVNALTLGLRGGSALRPLAVITTSREIHELVNAEGRVLAELVVDAVSAHAVNEPEVIRQWREVEVELVDGTDKLLRRAAKWLRAAGASDPSWRSKLAMAIGAEPPPAPDLGTLRGLFEAYLGGQHDAILRGDLDLRRGRDAIHDTRVATRRCRSVLRVYSGALDQERAAALDAELAWFATVLGEVRDRDVLRVHLVAAVDALPTTLVVGPVREQLTAVLDAEHATATTELAAAMRSRRYFAMLRELRVWRDQQPGLGDQSADHAADHLALAERKIRRRLRRLPDGGPERDAAIHRVRKAAKRARYAAELAEPALGKQAAAVGKRSKKLQRRLGDRQDHVLAAEFLLRVAQAGGGGFTLGVLHEREYRQAHAIA